VIGHFDERESGRGDGNAREGVIRLVELLLGAVDGAAAGAGAALALLHALANVLVSIGGDCVGRI
jgi:hypothetical protein